MELLQLRYFVTVAKLESVTKAANYYRIPQPAMSQTISRLEKEIGGVRLFDRKNNRIHLNENGRFFLSFVEKALLELDNGVEALQSHRNEISGSIHLLVLESRRFIFGCVSRFAERYPDISFSISHDYSSDQAGGYDLCVSSVTAYQNMRKSAPLIQERIVLAVHEASPLARRKSVSLGDLRDEKFITMSSRSSLYAITYDHCRACGFEPHVPFICDDPYFVRKYVSENMGVSLAPSISWAGRFRENTKLIPIDHPPILSTSYLIWDERRYLPQAVLRFRDYLLEEAAGLAGNLAVCDPAALGGR